MCECDILVYGCGHKQFLRLSLPCPAGLCPDHNECYAGNTRVARTYRVRRPPFCWKCFDKEETRIDEAFDRAQEDFFENHQLVHDFLRVKYARRPTNEDQDRIRDRLIKNRNIEQELLALHFYGPTRRIPQDGSAFLYRRPDRSQRSHRECIRAYRIVDDWDSSQDGDDEESPLDGEGQENGQRGEPQSVQVSDDDSAQDSEDGDYFRTYRLLHREFEFRRDQERVAAFYSDSDSDADASELGSLLRSIPPTENDLGSPARETAPILTTPGPPPAMPSTAHPTLSDLLFPGVTAQALGEAYIEHNGNQNHP